MFVCMYIVYIVYAITICMFILFSPANQSVTYMYKPEALAPSISATYWRDSSIIALASIPLNKQF